MKLSRFEVKNHVYKDAKRDKTRDVKHARKVNKQNKKDLAYKMATQY